MRRRVFLGIAAAALVGAATLASEARADRALVVGINRYPNLEEKWQLDGCVNDATEMAAVLRQYGFEVTLLLNEKATRAGILDAIRTVGGAVRPDERFVFYYAGHGTRIDEEGKAALVPCDIRPGSDDALIRTEELYRVVREVKAKSRTVLLDACYSGGMLARALPLGTAVKVRFYSRDIGGGARSLPVNGRNSLRDLAPPSSPVCYFAAARDNEVAAEVRVTPRPGVPPKPRGVFTWCLQQQLVEHAREPSRPAWGEVQAVVSREVQRRVSTQHPTLLPTYTDVALFESRDSQVQPAPIAQINLLDHFHQDRVDPERVRLTMTPDNSIVEIGEQFSFRIETGPDTKGYLIALEKGTRGGIRLLHPVKIANGRIAKGTVEDAYVEGARTIRIPEDLDPNLRLEADEPGVERVKVFLYQSQSQAKALLEALPVEDVVPLGQPPAGGGALPLTQAERAMAAKNLVFANVRPTTPPPAPAPGVQAVQAEAAPFFTSDLQFTVVRNKQALAAPAASGGAVPAAGAPRPPAARPKPAPKRPAPARER